MSAMAVHFSSERMDWATPWDFFRKMDEEFHFDLDVCATAANAKCFRYLSPENDGLRCAWVVPDKGDTVKPARCWMNPPYGREIEKWMRKAYHESLKGALVVCLVPARTDTFWWHEWAAKGEVRFIRGRLKFEGSTSSAPFPSAIVIFRPDLLKVSANDR